MTPWILGNPQCVVYIIATYRHLLKTNIFQSPDLTTSTPCFQGNRWNHGRNSFKRWSFTFFSIRYHGWESKGATLQGRNKGYDGGLHHPLSSWWFTLATNLTDFAKPIGNYYVFRTLETIHRLFHTNFWGANIGDN